MSKYAIQTYPKVWKMVLGQIFSKMLDSNQKNPFQHDVDRKRPPLIVMAKKTPAWRDDNVQKILKKEYSLNHNYKSKEIKSVVRG